MKKEQSVWCADDTCKHNVNGRCGAKEVEMVVAQDDHYKPVVICETYEDKRVEDDG